MTLIGMSDKKYFQILDEVCEIQFLIVEAGGMATKTVVENILMLRHDLDRGDAHHFTNAAEMRQDFKIRSGRIEWLVDRPHPQIKKYPELKEL